MGALTALLIVVGATVIGIGFYIHYALRRIAEKEVEIRVSSEVRRMEELIQNSPKPPTESRSMAERN